MANTGIRASEAKHLRWRHNFVVILWGDDGADTLTGGFGVDELHGGWSGPGVPWTRRARETGPPYSFRLRRNIYSRDPGLDRPEFTL